MNKTLKTFAVILFLINSQVFFAQEVTVDQKAQEIEAKKTSA